MEEEFQTYTETGEPLDLVPRSIVHRDGLWHRATNVFVFRSNGHLITQRRAPHKDVYPDTWDLSVAEHLKPGEDYLAAAIRGTREELGITIETLTPVGDECSAKLDLPSVGVKNYEHQMTFTGISDATILPQDDEVAEIREYGMDELLNDMAKQPERFTPWFHDRLTVLLSNR